MSGEKDLDKLLKMMQPELNGGDFVFCTLKELSKIRIEDVISLFKEKEGFTVIIDKVLADNLGLDYSFVASWITLTVHSSLDAVGLTATFSKSLSDKGISCNVVAGYYHDHIFVDQKDAKEAMKILTAISPS